MVRNTNDFLIFYSPNLLNSQLFSKLFWIVSIFLIWNIMCLGNINFCFFLLVFTCWWFLCMRHWLGSQTLKPAITFHVAFPLITVSSWPPRGQFRSSVLPHTVLYLWTKGYGEWRNVSLYIYPESIDVLFPIKESRALRLWGIDGIHEITWTGPNKGHMDTWKQDERKN